MQHIALTIEQSCRNFAGRPALRIHRDGGTQTWTYREMARQVEQLAAALHAEGLCAGDRAAICCPNRPEWTLLCLAFYRLRVLPVPIYASCTAAQILEIVKDSGASMLALGGEMPLSRLEALHAGSCPQLLSLETGRGTASLPTLGDLLERELREDAALQVQAALAGAATEDTAVLIYTSGTTGEPKGVMLSHANFFHQYEVLDDNFDFGPEDRSLCFLPLSHIYEHCWTLYVLARGAENVYLEDPKQVAAALGEVRPTVLCSVPRLYEKVMQTIQERVAQAPVIRQKLFHWAMKTGARVARLKLNGQRPEFLLALRHRIADRLVLGKLRGAIGGDKRILSAGGAALGREVEDFFHAAGLFLCQGYGLTETSPMVSCNRPGEYMPGTVGRIVPGCELRIAPETGEIQVKGRNVFQGYWQRPEATAAVMQDGWFCTGDVGTLDEHGYLRITDRIKDLIVTSQGKNVAPQRIEGLLTRDTFIEQAAAVGDGRKCVTALIVPVFEKLEAYASEHRLHFDGRESLLRLPEIMDLIKQRVEEQSCELARHEMIKRFSLLPEMFSEATGTLTPTLKLRRQEIHQRYQDMIDGMYSALDDAVIRLEGLMPERDPARG